MPLQLAIHLSKLEPFPSHSPALEQYPLNGNLAASLLWKAYLNNDIENKTVADLGCGNGILGIGAQLLGAKDVSFLDVDKRALDLAKKNAGRGMFFLGDVTTFSEQVDTVLMNPPFGVQTRKADKIFLETAMKTSKTIYSIHKIESKNFIQALCKEYGFRVEEIMEEDFIVKPLYSFHTEKKHSVAVGIWVLRKI
ncbi:MAG: methyltransferase [Thaumarchaeota archaeon]|nr:methyltransferase [Nitrososphaerota archaeon]